MKLILRVSLVCGSSQSHGAASVLSLRAAQPQAGEG